MLGIWQPHAEDVAVHDLPNARRDRTKEIAKLEIRVQGVRHVQKQLQSVAPVLQLRPCAWRRLKVK